jgi:hypothetical protein
MHKSDLCTETTVYDSFCVHICLYRNEIQLCSGDLGKEMASQCEHCVQARHVHPRLSVFRYRYDKNAVLCTETSSTPHRDAGYFAFNFVECGFCNTIFEI